MSSAREASREGGLFAPTVRRGHGVLLSEPSPGLDTVYDGASDMRSTAFLCGARGGRWSSSQTYGSSFQSATPRPWQRAPTARQLQNAPPVGPGDYEPYGDTHSLSASLSWSSRGRAGPVGYPFDADRRSPVFQSSVGRFHFAAKPKRGTLSGRATREDCFVLASDARREQVVRSEFVDQLQRRVQNAVFQPPQMRTMTAPGY